MDPSRRFAAEGHIKSYCSFVFIPFSNFFHHAPFSCAHHIIVNINNAIIISEFKIYCTHSFLILHFVGFQLSELTHYILISSMAFTERSSLDSPIVV